MRFRSTLNGLLRHEARDLLQQPRFLRTLVAWKVPGQCLIGRFLQQLVDGVRVLRDRVVLHVPRHLHDLRFWHAEREHVRDEAVPEIVDRTSGEAGLVAVLGEPARKPIGK